MALKDIWKDLQDAVQGVPDSGDTASAEPINNIAHAVINNEENIEEQKKDIKEHEATINSLENMTISSKDKGSAITLVDSAEMPLKGLSIYGKTEQFKTTGAQLLNNTSVAKTVNGVTSTVNADGSVTFNGTATANCTFGVGVMPVTEGNTYHISGCPSGGSNSSYRIVVHVHKGNTYVTYKAETGSGLTITADSTFDTFTVQCHITSGYTASNLTFYPMVTLGTTQKPYEPYTGGTASPSPEYPQTLNSLASDGTLNVDVKGKNLLDVKQWFADYVNEHNGISYSNAEVDNVYKSKILTGTFEPNTQYTFSCDCEITNCTNNSVSLICRDENKTAIWVSSDTATTGSLTTASGQKFVKRLKVTNAVGTTIKYIEISYTSMTTPMTVTLKNMQIEKGVADTEYEPHKGKSLTLSTPNGLPGVPLRSYTPEQEAIMIQKRNYVDSDGVSWVCDEIDLDRGVYVSRVWVGAVPGFFDVCETTNYQGVKFLEGFAVGLDASDGGGLCEVARYVPWLDIYPESENTFTVVGEYDYGTDWSFVALADGLTEEAFRAKFEGKQLLLIRKTPIEIPLSEAEIEAYKSLQTYKPATHIFNDEGAHMNVGYVADPKNYIDNKFAELQTALLNATT